MTSIAEQISHELLSWPGVTVQPHRFGGLEFRLNGHELGHLHGSRQADFYSHICISKMRVLKCR